MAKIHPIIFSGAMVRAILAGRKTQTRRIVKMHEPFPNHDSWPVMELARDGMPIFWSSPPTDDIRNSSYYDTGMPCPYGRPGDRLWVRETYAIPTCNKGTVCIQYAADGATYHALAEYGGEGDLCGVDDPCNHGIISAIKWRSPRFMPRWASRITLEVAAVRAERLQDISEADAIAEGITVLPLQSQSDPSAWYESSPGQNQGRSARQSYAKLWDAINAKRGYPWKSNPWVFVIDFRRIDQ